MLREAGGWGLRLCFKLFFKESWTAAGGVRPSEEFKFCLKKILIAIIIIEQSGEKGVVQWNVL